MDRPSKGSQNISSGTVLSGQNVPVSVSFGIPAVDSILGGGLPVGTLSLIEEDINGVYSKTMLKYYLAESIVNKSSLFVASQDLNPYNIIKELPAVIESDPDQHPTISSISNSDKMKIAFRYQNLPTNSDEDGLKKRASSSAGHYYDLTKNMSHNDIENTDIFYWTGQRIENEPSTFSNPAYNQLLKSIKYKIKEGKFFLKDNPAARHRPVLRIAVHSLGSPMWLPRRKSYLHAGMPDASRDLHMFIFCLRALVRSAYAVAVITIPTHLYHESSLQRCIHSSDIAIRLQAFCGTELEHSTGLSDYHGFFILIKLAAFNSFASKHPGSIEYVFKLKRKKFVVEKLHLPPDVHEEVHNNRDIPMVGCGSSASKLLEF